MKTFIYALVLVVCFLVFISAKVIIEWKQEKMVYPQYETFLKQDERTICEKKSEIALQLNWQIACSIRKEALTCSLPKENADLLFKAKQWYIESCQS